ncbi:hypothetical protein D3C83_274340 [compost metagenome]
MAISLHWAIVILPTKSTPGFFEPEPGFFAVAIFAAFLIRNDAGGVFITKVKLLSW